MESLQDIGMMDYDLEEEEEDGYVNEYMEPRQLMGKMVVEEKKKMIECEETLDSEPLPEKSLNLEEAFKTDKNAEVYESKYKNIPFLKEDVATVNSMSHCTAEDIAKLIRNIQNSAYTLGLDEARQCRRGKVLGILAQPVEHTPPRETPAETNEKDEERPKTPK